MISFGLTGGIATGKTTASKLFRALLGERLVSFDADQSVHALYRNPEVLDEIVHLFGDGAVVQGSVQRVFLREKIYQQPALRKQLEAIIHPKVRQECLALQSTAMHKGVASLFIADVPLLFEGGFDFGQSANLLVATTRETQVERLIMRDGFSEDMVQAILAAQLPISHKVKCADVVLWNEGPLSLLEKQIQRLITDI